MMKWCLADAFALALEAKYDDPMIDFPAYVNETWAWMQEDNATINAEIEHDD